MGKVDVILRNGGELEVRDYKSSEEARTLEEVGTQIKLYTSGLRTMGRPVTSGSVAYLDKPSVKKVDVSDRELSKTKKEAEKVIESISKRNFRAMPGESCKRCDQNEICKWRGK